MDDLNEPQTQDPEAISDQEADAAVGTEETPPAEASEDQSPVANPRFVVKRANQETDEVFLIHPPATLGRFDAAVGPVDVDLGDIEESGYVSRKHAKITQEDDIYKIEDLGSSNGTFLKVDGEFQRIEEATEIKSGDEIALGNARFVFYV